ncbi:NB-ARC domain-containing protein, partial [Streptomyces sp. ADI92-24]|uniref:NB-ARC domain-containing protein n=1 Tax=Streptomyces sp. ADI92-24 TaxID=1522756 RepID=UPI0013DD9D9E
MSDTGPATAIGHSIANSGYMYIEKLVQQSRPPVPPPPPARDVPGWVVGRAEADQVIAAVCSKKGGAVGITTALEGAGGFGKTTLADVVCASPRVRKHFSERVYFVTVGREARSSAAIAAKVSEATSYITGDTTPFNDPKLAGAHLGRLLDQHLPFPILLVLDDVWDEDQLAPFLSGGGQCVRLVTTRRAGILPPGAKRVRVDEMSEDQARKVLTWELPSLSEEVTQGLMMATGRWPLLLRMTNRSIARQLATGAAPAAAATYALEQLRERGPAAVDDPSVVPDLDVPEQRKKLVRATVEAATTLLPRGGEQRLAELGIFAEDEAIPIPLVAQLWHTAAGLDEPKTRQLCWELSELSLLTMDAAEGGHLTLHDVIRGYLREVLGPEHLSELNAALLDAVEADLPPAAPLAASAPQPRTAWWELADGYMLDHVIGHLLAAGRTAQAEAVASDLRWVETRLHHRGPTAPWTDLDRIPLPTAAQRAADIARTAHLLAPAEPAHALTAILHSRLEPLSDWHDQVTARQDRIRQSALLNHWAPPDIPHPALQRILTGHTGGVKAMVIAPDGTWLASAGADGTARIWDRVTGKETTSLTGHTGRVRSVAIAPDGTWLATADDRGNVRIWDRATGKETTRGTHLIRGVLAVAIACDGAWLAAISEGGKVRIWDRFTGATTITTIDDDRRRGEKSVAIAPDGSHFTISIEEMVRIRNGATGAIATLNNRHIDGPFAVAIAPDDTWFAVASTHVALLEEKAGQVWVRDRGTDNTRISLVSGSTGVWDVAIAPDGTWLASGNDNGTVSIWNRAKGATTATNWVNAVTESRMGMIATPSTILSGHSGRVRSVAIAPDGTWLATADDRGNVRIWDRPTGKETTSPASHTRGVLAVAIAPDGTSLTSLSGHMRVWNPEFRPEPCTGRVKSVAMWIRDQATRLLPARMKPVVIATYGASLTGDSEYRRVRIQDNATGHTTELSTGPLKSVAIAPDRLWLATATRFGLVSIWHLATGREIPFPGLLGVDAVAIAPGGRWFTMARAEEAGMVRTCIWRVCDTEEMAVRRKLLVSPEILLLTGHTGKVDALAIAPDGTWLATADE